MADAKKTLSTLSTNAMIRNISIGIGVVVLVLGSLFVFGYKNQPTEAAQPQPTPQTNKTAELDHTLEIPTGQKDENISFKITGAEMKDDVIIQGQKGKALEGKTFVIVNIKLTNPTERRVKLDTRDYLRLSVNDSEDRLAPNIHNDPVEIQPISDQYTRVGFSVYKTDTNFKLFVGKISEEKTELELHFN